MPRHLVVAGCLVALCIACASTLDPEGLEAQIGEQLADRFPGSTWIVSCPDDVAPTEGGTFACRATSGDDRALEIEVTQDDAQGSVVWRVVE